MEDKIKVYYKSVGMPAQYIEMNNTLASQRELIGGYMEVVPILGTPFVCVCDEEGRLKELAPNIMVNGQPIVGNVFVARTEKEEFSSITQYDYNFLVEFLPQII